MKKRKLRQKRILALALSTVMVFTSTDVSTLAAEADWSHSELASGTTRMTGAVNEYQAESGGVADEASGIEDGAASTEGPETKNGTASAEGSEFGDGTVSVESSESGDGAGSAEGSESGDGADSAEGSESGDDTASTENSKLEEGVGATEDSEIDDSSDASVETSASDCPEAEKNENEVNIDEDGEDVLLMENAAEDDADEAVYGDSYQILSSWDDVGTVGNIHWSVFVGDKNLLSISGTGEYLCEEYLEYPPWTWRAENVEGIYSINLRDIKYTKNMFYGFKSLKSIKANDFRSFDTSNVLDMEGMFSDCSTLVSLDLMTLITDNVTNMKNMFSGCSALRFLEHNLTTDNVTNMENMFAGCSALEYLTLYGFDTGNVEDMEGMFSGCRSLTNLDVNSFDTSKVTSMENMFAGCSGLTSLDLSVFDTGKVTSMENMFSGCSNLTNLDISGFNTSNVTNMENMFAGCSGLSCLDLSSFDMGNAVNVRNFISDCSGLSYIFTPGNCNIDIELPEGRWYGEDGTEYSVIPAGLTESIILYKDGYPGDGSGLTKQLLFISGVTVESKVYDGEPTTYTGTALVADSEGNEISGISLSESYSGIMADGSIYRKSEETPSRAGNYKLSYAVTGLDADRYILGKTSFDFRIERRPVIVTAPSISIEVGEMPDLEGLTCEVSGLLENDTLMTMPKLRHDAQADSANNQIIPGCYDIIPYGAEVDASVSNNYKIIYVRGKLGIGEEVTQDSKSLIASGIYGDISWKLDSAGKLTLEGDGDYTDSGYESAYYGRLKESPPWTAGYIADKVVSAEVNISNIKHTQFMFFGCKNLKSIDLSGLDTRNVVNMSYMFACCSSLESLDLSEFDTSRVMYMNAMFANCSSLKSLDLSSFNTSRVTIMGDVFEGSMYAGNEPIFEWNPGLIYTSSDWTRINGMFFGCSSLESLDLSNFDTSQVKRWGGMFCGCSALKTLDLSNFNTSLARDMQRMFSGCSSLTNLDLSNFDTSNFHYHDSNYSGFVGMDHMFSGCSSLISLDVSSFDTSRVEKMEKMFADCSSLTRLDLSSFDISGVDDNGKEMLTGCNSLTLIFTPRNLNGSVALPGTADDIWTTEDGAKYSELPIGHADSIVLYKNSYNEEEGTLTKRLVYISGISVNDKVYDGNANPYTGTPVIKDSDGNVISDIILNYAYTGTLENGTPYKGTAEEPPSQAGAYALHIEASGTEADKYIFYKNTYAFCIKQKEIIITAPSIQIELEGKLPELSSLTCVVNGEAADGELPEGEQLFTNLLLKYSVEEQSVNNSKPGKYVLIPYGAVLNAAIANNYCIKYEYGTLTVGDPDDNSPYDYEERADLSVQELNAVISNIKARTYNGYAQEPTVKVTVLSNGKKRVLTEGLDYVLAYKNNINAGTGTVIVKGRGEYKGELTKDFTIKPKSVKKLKYIIGSMSVGDDGDNPHIFVYDGAKLLRKGTDYTLSGTENLTAQPSKGIAITVTGIAESVSPGSGSGDETVTANYNGSKKIKIAVYDTDAAKIIKPADIYWSEDNASGVSLLSAEYSQPYTGKAIKPDVTIVTGGKLLTKNKDYKIQYQNNKNAGTAYVIITGKGEYKGKVAATFDITPLNIEDEAQGLEINAIADKTYNGKLQKPSVKIKAGGKTLKKNRDYTLSYVNNIHASTSNSKAMVIVTGMGNYSGIVEQEFTIKQLSIKKVSIKGTYEGGLTVTYRSRKLTEGIHYTVSYGEDSKNKITVRVAAKTGSDFTGKVEKKIRIK